MKLKVVTTSDKTNHPGWEKLKASLEEYGYDFEHIPHPFAFGHQMPVIQNWCNNYKGDCTHILYTDCFDTIAFGGPDEVIEKFKQFGDIKMLISAEKNCYPIAAKAKDYPVTEGPWKYVNGGGWLVEIEYFKQLCVKENLNRQSHDQIWLMDSFFNNRDQIKIDNDCEIFQTIAFSNKEEWEFREGRFLNVGTGTLPIFFHGNGHTEMNWVYKQAI